MERNDLVVAVEAELNQLAQRLVQRAYTTVDHKGALEIPHVESIAARCFADEWATSREKALEALLRQGSRHLKDEFREITEECAVLLMFNLDGSPEFPDIEKLSIPYIDSDRRDTEKPYGYLRRRLLERADRFALKDASATRYLAKLRMSLAWVLTDPDFPFRRAEVAPAATPGNSLVLRTFITDEYIPRPEYEVAIRQLRDSGVDHVWLHGDAGTGKTRLARATCRDVVSENAVPVLASGNEQMLLEQISSLVVQSGIDAVLINPANRWALFLDQLQKGRLPKVMVFDDLRQNDIVKRLVSTSGSFLIFTSVERPPFEYQGPSIEVRDLTSIESREMIRSRLPNIHDQDLELLDGTLAGRALAIEHSCSYVRETGMSIADYCAAVRQEPTSTLGAAGDRYGKTLTRIYEMTLERLALSDPAVAALDLILFMYPNLVTPAMLEDIWLQSFGRPSSDSRTADEAILDLMNSPWGAALAWPGVVQLAPVEVPLKAGAPSLVMLHAAIRKLEDFGLIRIDNAQVSMHQLTRAILRSLRKDQSNRISDLLMKFVHRILSTENWKGGEALPFSHIAWVPHLYEALDSVDVSAQGLFSLPTDELIRLATLSAMMMRAHRQAGSYDNTIERARHVYGAALLRSRYEYEEVPDRDALTKGAVDLLNELFEWAVSKDGFDRTLEKTLSLDKEPSSMLLGVANTFRLRHDTEWELSQSFVDVDLRENVALSATSPITIIGCSFGRYQESATAAVLQASIYYHQARWKDAIGGLEHAYSCYIKIGGNAECIRGALDAARRLSRVHLRAGNLNDAAIWLMRAQWVSRVRSESSVNGMSRPIQLVDAMVQAQLTQTQIQLELTNAVLEWDDSDLETGTDIVPDFVNSPREGADGELGLSRLEEAKRAVELVKNLSGLRLMPEFMTHALRLQILSGESDIQEFVVNLAEWFAPEDLSYRSELLALQMETFAVPVTGMFPYLDAAELDSFLESIPPEGRDVALSKLQHRREYTQQFYEAARRMRDKHQNQYWYARGLCACFIAAEPAGHPANWINGLRSELESAAISIDRPDWIEKTYSFARGNEGLWLFGY